MAKCQPARSRRNIPPSPTRRTPISNTSVESCCLLLVQQCPDGPSPLSAYVGMRPHVGGQFVRLTSAGEGEAARGPINTVGVTSASPAAGFPAGVPHARKGGAACARGALEGAALPQSQDLSQD